MDPQTTWRMLLDSWSFRHWEDVIEQSEDLLNWLNKDGFTPRIEHLQQHGPDLNRLLVKTTCEFLQSRAKSVLASPILIPADVVFSLKCFTCSNLGPNSYDKATAEGWDGIEYLPQLSLQNFLGTCPGCRANDQ